MHWKAYSECRGQPPCSEVVIRCSQDDRGHPWVQKRKAMYEELGRRVVVVTTRSDKRSPAPPDRSRGVVTGRAARA